MVLRSMIPGPSPDSPDWQAFVVAATGLGEGPTSRIGKRLREELGWSYAPGCQVQPHAGGSLWTCALPVESARGADAILEVERLIAEYSGQRPQSEEELQHWRGYLLRSTPASFDTTAGTLSWQASLWTLRLAPGWLGPHLQALAGVDLAQARAAARRYLDPQKLGWAAVGDGERLAGLPRPLVQVDADGLPMSP
jgi:predicted Zn-dependent peptidase